MSCIMIVQIGLFACTSHFPIIHMINHTANTTFCCWWCLLFMVVWPCMCPPWKSGLSTLNIWSFILLRMESLMLTNNKWFILNHIFSFTEELSFIQCPLDLWTFDLVSCWIKWNPWRAEAFNMTELHVLLQSLYHELEEVWPPHYILVPHKRQPSSKLNLSPLPM